MKTAAIGARLMDERGSAMVEMALSLIVIIPLVFYAILLNDLLATRLDLQEAVLSSTWDFTNQDYEQGAADDIVADVQHLDRLMWCDHTSAIDSYDHATDCSGESHHTNMGAHSCWLAPGAEQITCSVDAGVGQFSGGVAGRFASDYTRGGMFTCTGRIAALNYFVPQQFFSEFSSVDLTDREKQSGSVHGSAQSAGGGDVFLYAEQRFSLLVDTWALNTTEDVAPDDKSGRLYERVKTIYEGNAGYAAFAAADLAFFGAALEKQLLNPAFPALGDDPLDPAVSILHGDASSPPPKVRIEQDSGTGTYHATPWKDWEDDPYSNTWDQRGKWYMGCEEAEQCG